MSDPMTPKVRMEEPSVPKAVGQGILADDQSTLTVTTVEMKGETRVPIRLHDFHRISRDIKHLSTWQTLSSITIGLGFTIFGFALSSGWTFFASKEQVVSQLEIAAGAAIIAIILLATGFVFDDRHAVKAARISRDLKEVFWLYFPGKTVEELFTEKYETGQSPPVDGQNPKVEVGSPEPPR